MNLPLPKPSRSHGGAALVVIGILLLGAAAAFLLWPTIREVVGERAKAGPRGAGGAPGTADSVRPDTRSEFIQALQIRDAGERNREAARVLRAWLEENSDAAIAHLKEMSPGPDRAHALLVALDTIGRRDAGRALALARGLIRTPQERAFYSSFFAGLAAQEPAAAIRHLAAVPAGESRNHAVRAIAGAWMRHDPRAALAWAAKLSDAGQRAAAQEAAVAELASTEPLRAIATARELLTGAALQRTLHVALQKFAAKDPRAAAETIKSLPARDVPSAATVDVARAFAAQDPAAALAWTKSLGDPGRQRFALHTVLETWAGNDPQAAGKYVSTMEAGPTQMTAAAHVGRVLATANPQQASEWAQSIDNAAARDFALISIAGTWARREPANAARWASELPAGETRAQALNSALSYWLRQDAPAVQKFVAGLSGELQTAAATFLASALVPSGPRSAIEWARTLRAPEPRDSAVAAAYRRWREIAPADAAAWLKSANLPAATKTKLQRGK